MRRNYFALACIMIALGIAAGAFGAHGLEDEISDRYLDVWKTGWTYWMYNAIALMSVISFVQRQGSDDAFARKIYGKWGVLFWIILGSVIFTFSLSFLSLNEVLGSGLKILGAVTPIGGSIQIIAWMLLALRLVRHNRAS